MSYSENQPTESEKKKHISKNQDVFFCLGEDHPPSRCLKVANINSRKKCLGVWCVYAHVGVFRGILLQTAKTEFFNIKSDDKITTRLHLDSIVTAVMSQGICRNS